MNSDSKPALAGESSRRDFMQRMGTLAVASSLVANANAAPAPQMPMVRFGKHMISRLIIGINTLYGESHLSRFIDLEMSAWYTPERLVKTWKHCEELGINLMVQANDFAAKYNTALNGKMLFSCSDIFPVATDGTLLNPSSLIQKMAKLGPISIHLAGYGEGGSDSLWRRGQLGKAREWCKMVRDTGLLVAVTSHRPEVFMEIESQGWDVDYYMCCLYKYGRTAAEWRKAFASNPEMMPAELWHTKEEITPHYGGETAFAAGDPYDMFKVVKATRKPCFVYKLLASGRLCEKPEFVEARFKEVFENIKPSDAVVVGMYDKHEDQYAINAGLVGKYGSNTRSPASSA